MVGIEIRGESNKYDASCNMCSEFILCYIAHMYERDIFINICSHG